MLPAMKRGSTYGVLTAKQLESGRVGKVTGRDYAGDDEEHIVLRRRRWWYDEGREEGQD